MTILGALTAAAQNQTPVPVLNAHPHFEVASIKPSKTGAVMQDMRIAVPPSRFEAQNITLTELLASLSGFSGKVQGGPKWAESDRYDIVAKAEGEISPSERGQMIMTLLEDRFKFAVHREAKEIPGLALAPGKTPPDLKPSKDGEQTMIRTDERRQVVFHGMPMFGFVNYLSQMLHVTVVDRTRMPGRFDFTLDPERFATVPSPDGSGNVAFADRIRAAVEEFGFRLETQKVPVSITVIDHAERPTEN
jgi:bla regulator protein blaR1